MEKQELKDYFEDIYVNRIGSVSDICESIKCGYNNHNSMYWLEKHFECLGIIEFCYKKCLKDGRKFFYKSTLVREWFYENFHKKEYEVDPSDIAAFTFESLYYAILSGSIDRAVHMAELYGSIEVDEAVHPASILLGYGLKYTILNNKEKMLEYAQKLEESKTKRGMKQYADGEARIFRGLAEYDEEEFNKGLEFMLKHHVARMRRNACCLEEHFAYSCIAFAMLAKDRGINVTVKHELLPDEYFVDSDINYNEISIIS